jgi:hypothetical protein
MQSPILGITIAQKTHTDRTAIVQSIFCLFDNFFSCPNTSSSIVSLQGKMQIGAARIAADINNS